MGRAAVPLDTIWPNGSDPKTLVCVKAQCSVAELFNTVFGEPDLTEQLHKQRGDVDLVETPWYESREALPAELYTWQVSDPPNKPSATLRHRKVRFESPPTALASKPFQNEESQVVTELYPDTLYVVEAVSSTSAPYGDKFNVFFRYIFRSDGPSASGSGSALHVLFHIEWLPSMSRMMRPVVGKAIDAGVRGTFKIFRSALGGLRPVADIREAEMPVGGPPAVVAHEPAGLAAEGGEEAAAAEAAVPPAYVAPTAGFAPGVGPPPDLISAMTQQLVYKDQVVLLADLLGASLRSVSASDLGAQLLAGALTVWLISIVVAVLRGWQVLCAAGAAEAGGGGGLMWVVRLGVCWPLRIVDLPDSTAEVLTSLALVAAINWAVIRGTEALVRHLSRANPALLAAARHGGAGGGGGDVIGGVPFSQTPVIPSRGSSGGGAAAVRGSNGGGGAASRAPSASMPMSRGASITPAPPASGAGAAAAGKDKDKGRGGAGGAGGAASFFTGKLTGCGGSAADKPKPLRAAPAPKQFTAAQLRQLELGHVTSSKKASPVPPPAPPVSSAFPAAAAMTDAWAADLPAGMVAPSGSSATRAPSPPPRAVSPPPKTAAAVAADAAAGTAAGARSASAAAAEPASPKPGEGANGATTAAPDPAAAQPPPSATSPSAKSAAAAAAAAAPAPAAQVAAGSTTSQPGAGLTASSTFANMFTKEGIDSMAESLRSAFRWDTAKTTDFADTGSPDTFPSPGGPAQHQQLAKLKTRSDAGAIYGTRSAAPPPGQRSAGGTQSFILAPTTSAASAGAPTALSLFSLHSDMPLLPPQEEEMMYGGAGSGAGGGDDGYDGEVVEPAVVVEEVFENERFQPFRGWGHMWPGHFLPSDRVGHWSDRQGKPGGSASMVWEQVEPQLPPGWQWVEDDWQVDLEGLEVDAVDPDGWSYALDFYLLKYPPPPQGGKCSLKHFVRRRRYFRTRVRPEGRSSRSSAGSVGQRPESTRASDDDDGADGARPATAPAAAPPGGDSLAEGERLMSLSEGIPGACATGSVALPPAASAPPPGGSGGGSDGEGESGVELRPPAAAAMGRGGGGGGGGGLPRALSEAEGLSEAEARQQQQQQRQRQEQREEGSRRDARPSLPGRPSVDAAPPAALEMVRDGGGDGGVGTPSEMFVLSPKTLIKSHDPLGALTAAAEGRAPGAGDLPPRGPPGSGPSPTPPAAGGGAAAGDGSSRIQGVMLLLQGQGQGQGQANLPAAAAAADRVTPVATSTTASAAPTAGEDWVEATAVVAASAVPTLAGPQAAAPPLAEEEALPPPLTEAAEGTAAEAAGDGDGRGDGDGSSSSAATGAGRRTEGPARAPHRGALPATSKVVAPAPAVGGRVKEGESDASAAAAGAGAGAVGGVVEGPIIAADLVE